MNISRNDLYRIVLEEYLLGEGLRGNDAAEELLKKILGDKYRPPEERDPTRYAKHHGDTEPMEKPHASEEEDEDLTGVVDAGETYPIDTKGGETPFRARQPMNPDSLADAIGELIHGRDPEEVAEIFQIAFERLPGVELSKPGDEDYPGEETLYNPGAEGRPAISLGPLREHIADKAFNKVLEMAGLSYGTHSIAGVPGQRDDEEEEVAEGHYHDMGGEGEMYDAIAAGAEEHSTVQKIESAYHQLQDVFDTLEDEVAQDMASRIISDLETLMDTTEHPEDYRE